MTDASQRPAGDDDTVDFHSSADDAAGDELLADQLDAHLDTVTFGSTAAAGESDPHPELPQLRPVVDRLLALSRYLSEPYLSEPSVVGEETAQTAGNVTNPDDVPTEVEDAQSHIGKYQVVRYLQRGGQANTYLAFDPDLRYHVVIKVYHHVASAADGEKVLNEGRALVKARSPYVAQCYGADRHEGAVYLVLEYIRGKDLSQLRGERRFAVEEALRLVAKVAEGLAAVHACGLIHRDVKPANILVGDDGDPRLVDFGLAEPIAGAGLSRVAGTLVYMPPEQARGDSDRVDAAQRRVQPGRRAV